LNRHKKFPRNLTQQYQKYFLKRIKFTFFFDGSSIGLLAGRAYYLMLSGALGFPLLALWLIVALYLGRTYRGAIEAKRVVC